MTTPSEPLEYCPDCGAEGRLRDHVIRRLTDDPSTGHPARLHVCPPRYQCVRPQCWRSIFQHQLNAAEPGAKTTKRAMTRILRRLIQDPMSIQAINRVLGPGWNLVSQLATAAARSLVYADPAHLAGVRVLGSDEHCWKHVRGQGEDSFATIFVGLTPLIDGTGQARLLDVKAGHSANVATT